ncbi:zinc finger protein SNAI2 [Hemitrygon akajei]|uniref:zinc finger protein SNAI2 n=1 Tax=Hemitrygon akajei TaxID=2704970 RepID=UPI003BF9C4A0
MPRSFLVKKHFSTSKKPNYGELDTQTVIISPYLYESYPMPIIPQPEILSSGVYNPGSVWGSVCSALLPSPVPSDPAPASEYTAIQPSPLSNGSMCPAARLSPRHQSKCERLTGDANGSETSGSDEEERIGRRGSGESAVDAEKFRCNFCSKAYSTFSGLAKHKQLHCDAQTRKSFSCKYCEKEYVSLGALKMHIRTHTLPCVCKICGKAFSRPWLLQGHIRTHTGEKPFSCPHCSRAFADRSNLRAHLQTHSDVKKYQCKNCAKTFSRMSLLHKHEESGCCIAH